MNLQRRFKLNLQCLTLQLLRALFGLALQFFNSPLLRSDLLLLLRNLEPEVVVGFVLCVLTDLAKRLLDTFLNGQIKLARLLPSSVLSILKRLDHLG
jgi:hypothetical protein